MKVMIYQQGTGVFLADYNQTIGLNQSTDMGVAVPSLNHKIKIEERLFRVVDVIWHMGRGFNMYVDVFCKVVDKK